MEIGFIGLGKMGGNMVLRLVQGSPDGSVRGGHTVIGYARDPTPELQGIPGITLVSSLDEMVRLLKPPRVSARVTAGLRNQFGGHEIKRPAARKLEKTGEVKPLGEMPE